METESTVKYKPTPGRILVKLEDLNKSALQLTDSPELNTGKVIAVGDTLTTNFGATIPCPVKIGDTIQHDHTTSMGVQAYSNIVINGEDYRIVLFDGIMGVIGG